MTLVPDLPCQYHRTRVSVKSYFAIMDFGFVIRSAIILSIVSYCVSDTTGKVKEISDVESDLYLDSLQMITKYNYQSETHAVSTEDGYILNIFRIPKRGPPVLLVHGIGDSSDSWLVLGPSSSLAYRLADVGYDVWLFNSRGNKYSKSHNKKLSEKQYWDFSFEEMGSKDLPATIDYILSTTSESKLSYVGFSQGTTIFFVLCSLKPSYNSKIKQAVLLAPVALIKNIKSPFIHLYSKNYDKLMFLAAAGINEVFPSSMMLNMYHAKVCNVSSPLSFLCEIELYFNFGLSELKKLSKARLPVITSHIPAGASAKTFLHFLQGYVFKSFRRYDYGLLKNLFVYNSSIPPQYDLTLIDAPVTLIVSEIDWFSTAEDAKVLQRDLRNIIRYVFLNKTLDFTHLEFVYGERANSIINELVKLFLSD